MEPVQITPRATLYASLKPVKMELIILCTWLGAGRNPIAKYIALYQEIAPQAQILLVESSVGSITSTYSQQQKALKLVVEVILDIFAECRLSPHCVQNSQEWGKVMPKILLHTFSGGGTNSATQLLVALHETLDAALPLTCMIIDSGPAKADYWKSYSAMTHSLPRRNILERLLIAVVLHFVLLVLYTSIAMARYEAPETLIRRTLLDEAKITARGEGEKKKVCYLYSKTDKLVDWRDVVEHAEEARKQGWVAREVEFEGTAHVAHLVGDRERYKEAVKSMWK